MEPEKVQPLMTVNDLITKNTVGYRVWLLRTHYHCTIYDFSIKCDLTPLLLLRAETGFSQPQRRTIKKIAEACSASENWLIYGQGDMFADNR